MKISLLLKHLCNNITLIHYFTGRQCKLSERQETKLVNHLLKRAQIGNGATRNDIRFVIKDVLDTAETNHGGTFS